MTKAVEATRKWLERLVIGENLCPFAARPWREERVRIIATRAIEPGAVAAFFLQEALWLLQQSRQEVETTLIVLERALPDFEEYWEFTGYLEEVVMENEELAGQLQLVTFHPDYRFGGAPENDPANATNRSPYPLLQLLREESVSEMADRAPDLLAGIPDRNIAHLRTLGWKGIRRIMEK